MVWRAVRAVPETGPPSDRESFFEAGRNFILLVVLQRELARELGVRFSLCELADHPTRGRAARAVRGVRRTVAPARRGSGILAARKGIGTAVPRVGAALACRAVRGIAGVLMA
jgi:hypothetical protein